MADSSDKLATDSNMVKNSPVSIRSRQCKETAQALRDLADNAERGDCIGAVVAYLDEDNKPHCFIVGHAEARPRDAAWLSLKLQQALANGNF